jgi:hypothetical protein
MNNWNPISLPPAVGDIIACCAKHIGGGSMFWAGRVTDIHNSLVTLEVKDETTHQVILTPDTLWFPLPPDPRPAPARCKECGQMRPPDNQ